MTDPQQKALEEVFLALVKQLQNQGFTEERLTQLVQQGGGERIPATAFNAELTPLETLARYLEHNPEAHKLLGRTRAAVAQTLENSRRKHPGPLPRKETPYSIPVSLFANHKRSALAHICFYLRDHYHLRNKEIAALIGRDPRVIATVLSRGEQR